VCHTELDEIEGRLPPSRLPRVPGHQVVGRIESLNLESRVGREPGIEHLQIGDRVGVAWIHHACGACAYCLTGRENLCADFVATGRDVNGGYAEFMTAPAAFVHRIPAACTDVAAAPLLCAGAIGYRSLALTQLRDGEPLGLTGFGASAHLVLQMARHLYPRSPIFVFARDPAERAFASSLGAAWSGDTADGPPDRMAAAIDTTPAWTPAVSVLRHLLPAGRLVINAIRKEAGDRERLADLDYPRDLWLEKEIKSVANVTRDDVRACLALAAEIGLAPNVQEYALDDANQALADLKHRAVRGAKVLRVA
jgi:propanol-preferring alcohol dehydrogenase